AWGDEQGGTMQFFKSAFLVVLACALSFSAKPVFGAVEVGAGVNVGVGGGVSVGAGANTDIGFFHDRLAHDGKWVTVPEYGEVFVPSVELTINDWRPYFNDGHWVFTDAGWYWDSTYAWGWAGFHYGRWAFVPEHRWVWIPDVTWGPSWVVFREGDAAFGWA